jgi:predicted aspartyl protease
MRISIGLAIALVSAVPAPTVAADREITPFQLLDDASIVVPVTIGGTGHYRFVLDTGSSRTVISSRLWKALRLPVVAKTLMVTPARRHDAYVVRVHGIAVAGGPEVDLAAAVIEADRYADGQQIDGLIGQDLLATAIYTIDYRQRIITWHAPGDTFAGVRLPLVIHDNRVLVSLAQCEGDTSPLQLIPDTGSDSLVLFAHAQDKLRSTPREVGLLWSMASARLAQRIKVEELMIGDMALRDPPAVIVDSGAAGDLMGDGLLPLHLFSRVTFNAAERYLIVQQR